VGTSGTQAKPLSWNVRETGHMGHHLKGTLVFPLGENNRPIIDDQTKSFEIVVNDIAGVNQRVFSWEVIATSQLFSDKSQEPESTYLESSESASLAPAFTLPSTKGEISLSDYAGKKNVLLYFQEGVMCAPCWEQTKDIQKVYDRFQELDVEVLTITVDPMNALQKASARLGITLPVLEDADLKVSTAYDVLKNSMHPGSRPGHTFVLIDKDGNMLWKKEYFIASGSTKMTMDMNGQPMTMDMGGMDMGTPDSVMYVPVDELLAELNKVLPDSNTGFSSNETSMSQMESGSMEGMDHSMCLTPIHNHVDFKIYLNGNPLNLAQRKYMDQSMDVHFHPTVKVNPDDVPGVPIADIVHVHKENVTVRDFLNTLDFDADTLKMLNDEQKLKVYANGDLRQEGLDYVMQDKDRILVSYGSETESEIVKQIESVTTFAIIGKDKNPSLFGGC
ncbi:MAG: redoxin domain-containing protein, partial [Nitrososphaerales archaeon]